MADISSSPVVRIGIVVVGHNVNKYGSDSVLAVFRAAGTVPGPSYHLVAIDDGSTDSTAQNFRQACAGVAAHEQINSASVVSHASRLGFSAAILSGLDQLNRDSPELDLVLVLPGNDQVEVDSIADLLRESANGGSTLGYRTNKGQTRPPAKLFASRLLHLATRAILFPNLVDLTGQYVVPPKNLTRALLRDAGHAWPVHLVSELIEGRVPVAQIPILLRWDFAQRPRELGFRRSPRARDAFNYVCAVFGQYVKMRSQGPLRRRRNRRLLERPRRLI